MFLLYFVSSLPICIQRIRTRSSLLCTSCFLDILTQFSLILILINRSSRLMIRSSPDRGWVIVVIALIPSKAV